MMNQAEFNTLYRDYERQQSSKSVSRADKYNFQMDLEAFKKEFKDLKDTAEKLPDDYVEDVCELSNYPFDEVIDEVEVDDWVKEVEDFLNLESPEDKRISGMYPSSWKRESKKLKIKKLLEAEKAVMVAEANLRKAEKDLDKTLDFVESILR